MHLSPARPHLLLAGLAALAFSASFEKITFEQGVAAMGPVRNIYENRPV